QDAPPDDSLNNYTLNRKLRSLAGMPAYRLVPSPTRLLSFAGTDITRLNPRSTSAASRTSHALRRNRGRSLPCLLCSLPCFRASSLAPPESQSRSPSSYWFPHRSSQKSSSSRNPAFPPSAASASTTPHSPVRSTAWTRHPSILPQSTPAARSTAHLSSSLPTVRPFPSMHGPPSRCTCTAAAISSSLAASPCTFPSFTQTAGFSSSARKTPTQANSACATPTKFPSRATRNSAGVTATRSALHHISTPAATLALKAISTASVTWPIPKASLSPLPSSPPITEQPGSSRSTSTPNPPSGPAATASLSSMLRPRTPRRAHSPSPSKRSSPRFAPANFPSSPYICEARAQNTLRRPHPATRKTPRRTRSSSLFAPAIKQSTLPPSPSPTPR